MIHCFLKKQGDFFLKFTFILSFAISVNLANAQTVDCSISANCSNSYCQFAANIEKGCNCFDNIDNDGDGRIDKADSNCATYYGLVFVGPGSDCSIVPPGANTPFDLVNAPITSAQNTADTQSKVSVGDVDGDGIPDAVITSKWNSEIRVVATASGQADGTPAGQVKSDFKTTGPGAAIFSGTGGCDPKNLLFEHENLIADIDKDGKSELFAVVSNRGGNPSTPPTCFFLVGFRYAPAKLQPLYNAVQIGTDRPGTFGIADMDGDGKAEIYLRDRIYAAETGALLATANGNWDLDVTSGPVAVNILGDSKMELVCGTKIYSIPSFTNRNPATPAALPLVSDMNTLTANKAYVKLAIDPVEYGTDTHSMCSVADIDRDGVVDVVISGALNSVTGPTAVFYWNVAKGTVSYYLPIDPLYANGWPWGTGRVNIGDANGDGRSDLSFISGSRIHCLTTDAAGNLVPLWAAPRIINDTRSGVLTVSIYDFNNDGKPEMIYRDSQELVVIDGATGTTKLWSAVCQSHTYTEGPVIADVNGDGSTDICVPCNTNNSFNINAPIQQQALGQFRLYFSSGNEWLPTRKVWNQPGYFVTNIKDNLTLPFPQLDQNVIFGTGNCLNGLPGPQMPMNVFLNQVPYLSAEGCPVYPAPDLAFFGDNPARPGVDENGDGLYTPAVEVIPPVCGDLGISVRINIVNSGDLPITANVPVSFFIGDPTAPSITRDSLIFSTTISIINLGVGRTFTSPFIKFNGSGRAFRMYIVLNNDGSILPIDPTGSVPNECRINNNVYSVFVQPSPFITKIEKIRDNYKCANSAPNNGELRVRVYGIKGKVADEDAESADFSAYSFQWYTGPASNYTLIPGATNYNITGLAEGAYTVIVRNTIMGCTGIAVDTTILRLGNDPGIIIKVNRHQTVCNPPNGELKAVFTTPDSLGYTYEWLNTALNPLGISTRIANNLIAGNYIVRVSKDGCSKNSLPQTVNGPIVPDAQASTLQNIVDCLNPNSGSVTATAFFGGVAQNPADYTFDWYFYNSALVPPRGSILPPANGTGETRTGLPVGEYQVVVTNKLTQCVANQLPVTAIISQTVIPIAAITQVAPQTSCDPAQPNGILTATGSGTGLVTPNDFTFQWFKGDNTLPANLVSTVSGVKGETVNKVSGGGIFYTVRITTANNCSDTEKFIIAEDVNVPVVTLTASPNTICDPAKATSQFNGSVTASVTFKGITVTDFTNYKFIWHQGSLITDPVIPVANDKSPNLTQLNGGYYTVEVKRLDLFCNSAPKTAQVTNAQVLPAISLDKTASTNCVVGKEDGKARAVTIDGAPATTAGYTFSWTGPASPAFPVTVLTNKSNEIELIKLQGGSGYDYTLMVTNTATGCTNTKVVNVPDSKVLPSLSLATSDNTICAPAANFNGSVTATVSNIPAGGSLTDYTFSFGGGMGAGIQLASPNHNQYTKLNGGGIAYTATTEHVPTGCLSSQVTILVANKQDIPDNFITDKTASTNCVAGKEDGKARILSVDGAPATTTGYSFSWAGPASPAFPVTIPTNKSNEIELIKVQGGSGYDYTLTVTNTTNGCIGTTIVNVPDSKALPTFTIGTTPNSICNIGLATLSTTPGAFNGNVSAALVAAGNYASAGIGDFSFVWSGGATPPSGVGVNTYNSLDVGTYSVIATHTNTGCVSASYNGQVVSAKVLPTITMGQQPSTYCTGGTVDGIARVTALTPVAQTYNYNWYDGNAVAGGVDFTDLNSIATTSNYNNVQGGMNGVALFQYTVEVTILQTGCVNSGTVGVDNDSQVPVLGPLQFTDNINCTGTPTGTANVNTGLATAVVYRGMNQTNPYPGFTFAWTGPSGFTSTATSIASRPSGVYTLTTKHTTSNCTSNPVTVTINDNFSYPKIDIVAVKQTSCSATKNGSLTATIDETVLTPPGPVGVIPGYTFTWVNNVTAATTTSNAITNQSGNQNYTITAVRTATGCSSTQTVFLDEELIIPTVTTAITNLFKCAPPDGKLVATPSPGVLGDYQYFWYDGSDAANEDAVIAVNNTGLLGTVTTNTYDRLVPGEYSLVVRRISTQCKSAQLVSTIANNAPAINPVAENTSVPGTCAALSGVLTGAVRTSSLVNFSGSAATDELTLTTAIGLAVNNQILIQRNGLLPLPVGILENQTYFVETINGTGTIITLKDGIGTHIDITANGDGRISNFISAGYTFNWYDGVPNGMVTTDPIDYFTNPPNFAALIASEDNPNAVNDGLKTGVYSLEVTDNATGCRNFISHTLPFVGSQAVIRISKTNSLVCNPPNADNGSVTIQIEHPSSGALATDTYNVTLRRGATVISNVPAADDLVNYTLSAALSPGSYIVEVVQNYAPNCPIYQDVVIGRDAFEPVISLTGPLVPNDACTAVAVNGRINFNVSKDASDLVVGATYNIGMLPDPNGAFPPLLAQPAGNYSATNLPAGNFTITATASTGCSTTKTFTVINNPVKSQLSAANISISDAEYCDVNLEQSAKVIINQINIIGGGVENLNDYQLDWYTNATLTANIFSAVGDATPAKGGEELSNTGAPLPSVKITNGPYWVVSTKKTDVSGTGGIGCASAPYSLNIASKKISPQMTLTPFGDTSCDPAFFEGSISVDVTTASGPGMAGAYDYTWAPTGAAGQPVNSLGNTGSANIHININEGTYTLTARNQLTGCPATLSTTLNRKTPPVFTVNAITTDLTSCGPFNGKIDGLQVFVDGVGGTVADFDYLWFKSDLLPASKVLDGQNAGVPVDVELTLVTYPAIALDKYFVKAIRKAGGAGVGCESTPLRKDILDSRVYPQVSFTTISSTSCDNNFDGRISVTANTTSGPGAASNYNFVWTNDPDGLGGTVYSASNSPTNSTASPYVTLNTDKIGAVSATVPGQYAIRVTNFITQCFTDATVDVLKATVPLEIVSVNPKHVDVCSLPANGGGTVTDVKISGTGGNAALFTYTWDDEATMSAPNILTDNPSLTLSNQNIGTYYVRAKRNVAPSPVTPGITGSGCLTAPLPFTVLDNRLYPVISFTTQASTSCDNNFDGQISVTATTTGFPNTTNYNFDWTGTPVGTTITDRVITSPYNYQAGDVVGPGTYLITVTNQTNSCPTTGTISLQRNPQPLEILTISKTDQLICYADGSITVNSLSTGAPANYSFNWYRNSATSSALVNGTNATITAALLDKNNYPTMGAGTYFVVGTKNASSSPGSGCLTPPFKVDIKDLHVDPNLAFTFKPNSSCDLINPNGQLVATAQERNGTTDSYTFNWTFNSAALPSVTTQTGVTPNSQLNNAFEGKYALLVTNTLTGCTFTSGLDVNLDLNISLPNIIKVDTFDPTNCLGSGMAEVTAISIGGGPAITGPPLSTDFQYEWYVDDFAPANQVATTTPLLGALNPGRFYVRVRDLQTECKSSPTEVVILQDDIIYPVVTITQTALQISCITTTGTAGLLARGDGQTDANPNYQFTWFNNLNTTAPQFASTSAITNLQNGDYSVSVTNSATGCSATDLFIIKDDSQKFLPQLSLNTEGRANCLVPDGVLLAREVGYSPTSGYPYPVSYTTEIYPGANPNTSQPGTVMNYVLGFNRNWIANNLDVGSFTVKITDDNTGCFVTGVNVVADARVLPVVQIVQDNPLINCNLSRPNGQLSATADGGLVGGYQFDWYAGGVASGAILTNNNKLIGRTLGQYTVRVVNDITGCFTDDIGNITDGRLLPPTPTALLIFDRTRCDYPDGRVAANVNGITLNYSFDWYDGSILQGTPDFNGVYYRDRDIGFYTVTAKDETTGCISLPTSVEVKDLRVIPEVIITTTPSYCGELPGTTGGTGYAEIQLLPANAVTDEVTWNFLPNTSTIGVGSFLTNILPGLYQANVVTSQGCESFGVGEVQTEILSYNLVSANGDRKNDNFRIDCISQFPNNNVKIFNRSGVLVYEADGYDNNDIVFRGIGERGVYTIGNQLPVGTYFYIIDKRNGTKPKTGYLELVK